MNKICVYAIAKNEEKNVEKWVESMSPADHIIVLDTGSTDKTVELLSSLGVEVHQKIYDEFRFDTARNDSLALVPDEYNIRVCTDLDEFWESSNWADVLRENWDEEKPRVIYKYVWSHTENGNGKEFVLNKIHGKDPNLFWDGIVHEHLMDRLTHSRQFSKFIDLRDKLVLHHFPDYQRDKKFYLDLIKKRVQENPNDHQAWFLWGNEEKAKGSIEEALKAYSYVLEHADDFPELDIWEKASLYYNVGYCYLRTNKAIDGMNSFCKGIAENKYYKDNYLGLGDVLVCSGLYDMAIGVLEEGLKAEQPIRGWMDDPLSWSYGFYNLLSIAYSKKNEHDKALGYAAKALSYEPSNPFLQQRYTECLSEL